MARMPVRFRHLAGLCLAAIAAIVLAARPSVGQQDEPRKDRIARLVRELGSESYSARTAASRSLQKIEPSELGDSEWSAIERAAASDDAEVAIRAARLLRRFEANALWEASAVTLDSGQARLSEVLMALGDQTSNRFLLNDALSNYRDGPVALEPLPQSFWPCVDAVCRQTGNSFRQHFDPRRKGLVLLPRSRGDSPVAYAGPFRAELTGARRAFTERFDFSTGDSHVEHSFQFDLQIVWEDRLRLVAYQTQPAVVFAETSSGKRLRASDSVSRSWNVLGNNTRQLSATLRLEPPPIADREIQRLVLHWPMIAVGDMVDLVVPNPQAESEWHQDDLSLSIDALQIDKNGLCRTTVRVSRDLVTPEPAEVALHECRITMLDAEGRPYTLHGKNASLVGNSARWAMTFRPPDKHSVLAALRLTYPRIRDAHNVVIEFADVPLPTARPE